MAQAIIPDRIVKDVATETSLTTEELEEGILKLQDVLHERVTYHYKNSRLRGGRDHLLLRSEGSYWFAFLLHGLKEEIIRRDVEMTEGMLHTVASMHLQAFQDLGYTISFSRPVAYSLENPFYFPIRIGFSEDWMDGRHHVEQRMEELVLHNEMTPAEALDYWMVEDRRMDASEWAGYRRVEPEAIRKNVRQAREKVSDPEPSATHEANDIRAERVEDIPDGDPLDEEEGRFYIPFDDDSEEIELESVE